MDKRRVSKVRPGFLIQEVLGRALEPQGCARPWRESKRPPFSGAQSQGLARPVFEASGGRGPHFFQKSRGAGRSAPHDQFVSPPFTHGKGRSNGRLMGILQKAPNLILVPEKKTLDFG